MNYSKLKTQNQMKVLKKLQMMAVKAGGPKRFEDSKTTTPKKKGG